MANFTTEDLAFTGYSKTVDATNTGNLLEIYDALHADKIKECKVVHFWNQFLEKYKVPQTKASFQKAKSFLQRSILEHQIY